MEFRFGHLVDYATQDARGKLILVGLFEIVHVPDGNPVGIPMGSLVASFRAAAWEGATQTIELRVTDADGADVHPRQQVTGEFLAEMNGVWLRANVVVQLTGLSFPALGDYAFRFYQGETQIGEVPIQFVGLPAAPTTGVPPAGTG